MVTDFNATGIQPLAGDPFTYGTETSLNTGFTLFPNFQANGTVSVGSGQFTTDGTLANYYISEPISGPSVGRVATGGPLNFENFFTVPTNVLVLMPGQPSLSTPEITVTRFTAPENGVFDITGSFTDLEAASVSLVVLINGVTEFSGGFSGQSSLQGTIPFSISDVYLTRGTTIDFAVDSLGDRSNDVLGLTAQITETPVTPTVAVSIDNTDVNIANRIGLVTFAFSAAPAAFTLSDTSAVGGTLSNLQQVNATTYTAPFTGDADTDTTDASVSVTAGSWQDGNGNSGATGSTAPFTVDTVRPTVTVSIDNTDVNVARPTALVTFTFSKPPTDFSLNDVTSADGSLSNLSGSGTTYTATFTASPGVDDNAATVSVINGSYHDTAGNAGTGGSTTASAVNFSSAVATFYEVQNDWAPSQMIDGIFTGPGGINGWSVYNYATGVSEAADALLTIASPLPAGKYELTFTIYQNYYGNPGHLLGDFALDYTTVASPTLSSPQTPVSIQLASSLNGTTFSYLSPGELLANTSKNSIGTDTYTISALVDSASPITGIFLDAIKNPSLPGGGPGGQYGNGNFVVSEFTLNDAAITGGSTAPFTIDTVTPPTPVAPADSAVINGYVNATHDTAAQALTGSAEDGSTVTVYDNSAQIGTTTANATTGAWSLPIGVLANGSTHSYTATATDAAGNVSQPSAALNFTVDITPPATPAAPADSGVVNGYVNAAHDTAAQALTGSAEDGSTVTIYDNSTRIGTTTADASTGSWSLPIGQLADGSAHSYTVTATDAAGNVSQPSAALSFVVHEMPPTIAINVIAGDDVLNAVKAQQPLGITGTSTEAVGQAVTVGLNGVRYTGTIASDGSWSVTIPQSALLTSVFPDGKYTVTADVSDKYGNAAQEATRTLDVDEKLPIPQFLYVPNEYDNTISVVDTSNNTVVATIPVGGTFLDSVAVRGDGAFVYAINENGTVSVIDTGSNSVVATINVGGWPWTFALNTDGTQLYVTNHSGGDVVVIDTASNTIVATINVGGGPYGVGFSPDGTRAYVTNESDGTVSVINTVTDSVLATINVGSTPTRVVVSNDGSRAYVNNYGSGSVSVIDASTNSVIDTIAVGSNPYGVVVGPNGSRVYVANYGGTVSVIDTTTDSVIDTIDVGPANGIAITPDGSLLYVSHYRSSNTVTVIDTSDDSVVGTIPVGSVPEYLGIASDGNALLGTGETFIARDSGALASTLASGPSGSPGPIFTGGTLQFAGPDISVDLPIGIESQGGTVDTNGNNGTLSGIISGSGSLTKIGAGALTLAGLNTYTGSTTVTAGTLAQTGTGTLGVTTNAVTVNGATAVLDSAAPHRPRTAASY